ncbi:helix-turn-helix domain-containing protein [Paenibacillus sp. TAB 01]|uniref:helix-turn-helix domain-containing protein n=1 Tax=Paenibacillus sp. TAB 01 TaxID=3368988 RepID=UPI00374FFB51
MNSNYFNRLIWFGCLSVCLPIILAGVVYYHYSMKQGISRFQENSAVSLNIIQQFTEKSMHDIEDDLLQLALDPLISDTFSMPNYERNYTSQMELLNKISIHKSKTSLIGDIYYYNRAANLVLSHSEGYHKFDSFKFRSDMESLDDKQLEGQWVYLPEGRQNGFLSFALKLPSLSTEESKGLLMVQLETAQITKYFDNLLSLTNNESIYVIDEHKRLLLQSRKTGDPTSGALSNDVIQMIGDGESPNGFFFVTGPDHQKYYYSYLKSMSGNIYVSMIPYQAIIGELSWIRWVSIAAVLIFIAVGVLLTVINLKYAYHPIVKLMHSLDKKATSMRIRAETLSEELAQSIPPLMERFLQQWLSGNFIQSSTLYDEFAKFGIPLDRNYVVMLVKPENRLKDRRFRSEDKSVVTFVLTNVMTELLKEHTSLQGYVLHDAEGLGTVILHFDRSVAQEAAIQDTIQYAQAVHQALMSYLKLHVSIGIGRLYPHIADIRVSYRESRLALQYRLHKDNEAILYIAELEGLQKQQAFSYPGPAEQQILDALKKRDYNQACAALEVYTQTLKTSESYNIISQGHYVLLSSIISSVDRKGEGISEILEYDVFEQLRTKESIEDMYGWFTQTLFPLYEKMIDENYNTKGRWVIKQVREYVQNNVSKDISLAECSEMFQTTPSYLSRLFKKEVGMTFLDFVTECKITEAMTLLIETDRQIHEIAYAVGYTHRNFNRIFQRILRMSPSDYRAAHR